MICSLFVSVAVVYVVTKLNNCEFHHNAQLMPIFQVPSWNLGSQILVPLIVDDAHALKKAVSCKARASMGLKGSIDDRPLQAMVRYGLAVASRFQGALPQHCAPV